MMKQVIFFASVAIFGMRMLAAPGDLDATFGAAGKVTTLIGSRSDAYATVIQDDGKILVAGYSGQSNDNFALARYQKDGSLDATFGSGGIVTTDFSASSDQAYSMALQADGKIILAGTSANNFALARYLTDGTLDTSFNGTGKLTTDLGGTDVANSVAVQNDGKIVAAGYRAAGDYDFAVARYLPDGTLDASFNGTGTVVTPIGSAFDYSFSVLVQNDGKLVVTGTSYDNATAYSFAVVRYNPDGTLDDTFNGTGKVTTAISNGDDIAFTAALQRDGKLVIAGYTKISNANFDFSLVRYTTSGQLDTSFNGTGIVTTPVSSSDDRPFGLAIQGNGRIVVVGQTFDGSNNEMFSIVRYTPDGALDTSFNGSGIVTTDFGTGRDIARSIAIQQDGKLLVAGSASVTGVNTFALARLDGSSPFGPPVSVLDTTKSATGENQTKFMDFEAPAIDGGSVGGVAKINTAGKEDIAIYDDAGTLLYRTHGFDQNGGTFTAIGNPVFGGDRLGFAGTFRPTPQASSPLRLDANLWLDRLSVARPGGKLSALYSRNGFTSSLRRIATQTGAAPGGGQFARFTGFSLPRTTGGLVFTATLHLGRDVNRANNFGVWRANANGTGSDLLLRHGKSLSPTDPRVVQKISLLTPVSKTSDQRRSVAPDGSVGAAVNFKDGSKGIVLITPDGSIESPVQISSPVPDANGIPNPKVKFTQIKPPAIATRRRMAFFAALTGVKRGIPVSLNQGIFANRNGKLSLLAGRGDALPSYSGSSMNRFSQPAISQTGSVAFFAALAGRPANNIVRAPSQSAGEAIVTIDNDTRNTVVRLGDIAPGYGDDRVVFRRLNSMVLTDSTPARVVFTAIVSGPEVNGTNNKGLWCYTPNQGLRLMIRTGSQININGQMFPVRTLDALNAPKTNVGQGRSTDEDGFVTAKVSLLRGPKGVVRIPLP